MLEIIKRNVEGYGFHVYHISGGPCPRFSYSIGLRDLVGAEVVFAGGAFFEGPEPGKIMDCICRRLLGDAKSGRKREDVVSGIFPVNGLGTFALRRAHDSWVRVMLLGALDYYDSPSVPAFQIVPEAKHQTLDVPDLSKPRSLRADPGWAWLDEPWPYEIPKGSLAMTNLLALHGARIGEAVRWEDGWHLYASQESPVEDKDLRLLPIGLLLGADPSLEPVVKLEVGQALWRGGEDGVWEPWDD
jgi:Domain of unknown function (DUF4262)